MFLRPLHTRAPAAIEFSVLTRQCLGQRLADAERLRQEVGAWEGAGNKIGDRTAAAEPRLHRRLRKGLSLRHCQQRLCPADPIHARTACTRDLFEHYLLRCSHVAQRFFLWGCHRHLPFLPTVSHPLPASTTYLRHDPLARLIALFGVSFPSFWLGIVLILIVTVRLGLLPPSGRGGLSHLILPAVTLGLGQSATLMRLLRASMLEVLGADYIRTARAKGLRDVVVYLRHALRNALIPVVTVLGLQLGNLLGGAIIVEVVFAWPGMGQLAIEAIGDRDYALVQSVVVLLALIFVAINSAVDMIYVVLDPKIRLT